MEKKQSYDSAINVWPGPPSSEEEKKPYPRKSRRPAGKNQMGKQSDEDMIRELQGIFCKGRYRSWVFSELRRR